MMIRSANSSSLPVVQELQGHHLSSSAADEAGDAQTDSADGQAEPPEAGAPCQHLCAVQNHARPSLRMTHSRIKVYI